MDGTKINLPKDGRVESLKVGKKLCLDPCNCSHEFSVAPGQLLEAGYMARCTTPGNPPCQGNFCP